MKRNTLIVENFESLVHYLPSFPVLPNLMLGFLGHLFVNDFDFISFGFHVLISIKFCYRLQYEWRASIEQNDGNDIICSFQKECQMTCSLVTLRLFT